MNVYRNSQISILDLDSSVSYKVVTEEYQRILYTADVWPTLERDYYYNSCEILQELLNEPENITTPFIKDLNDKCIKILREHYTHVAAYHACRFSIRKKYRQLGILTSSQKRLEARAKKLFSGLENLNEALSEAKSYFRTYNESISMYTSAEFASTEYLIKGSHYLRMVAANLGGNGESRLLNEHKGTKPYFVQCAVPLEWIEDRLFLYNASLVMRFIHARLSANQKYEEAPQPLIIFKGIPPENILAFLNPNVCTNWKNKNNCENGCC